MPVIKYFYQQYGDAQDDLAKRIKVITGELQYLNQLVTHGQRFAQADKLKIIDEINVLNESIRHADFNIDSYEISQRIAQFNLHSLEVLDRLESLNELPGLEAESQALEECVEDFNQFEQSLSQDPSRKEVMLALNKSAKLLAQISDQIENTRDNPCVAIAQCWFEGAEVVALMSLQNRPHPF